MTSIGAVWDDLQLTEELIQVSLKIDILKFSLGDQGYIHVDGVSRVLNVFGKNCMSIIKRFNSRKPLKYLQEVYVLKCHHMDMLQWWSLQKMQVHKVEDNEAA